MKGFITCILFCFAILPANAQETSYTVLFDFDKYDIPDTSLLNVINIIHTQNVERVLLEGHCDSIGSRSYNYTLSDNRAGAVRKLLMENGVASENIKQCIGFGKDRPLTQNATPAERQINRRVVATFYLKDDKSMVLKENERASKPDKQKLEARNEKNELEKWDFLKIEATRNNPELLNSVIAKKNSRNTETTGMKPVIIKTEVEKQDFLQINATRNDPEILNKLIANKNARNKDSSGLKPVIIKSEAEKQDFLQIDATRNNPKIFNDIIARRDSLKIEPSGVRPVIIKSEVEKKDFLKIDPNSARTGILKKDSLNNNASVVKPVISKSEVKKRDFRNNDTLSVKRRIVKMESSQNENLNIEPTRVRTDIANIGDAKIGDQIVLENILFEPGRHYLKPESMGDLENLLSALNAYPTLEIEIQGHVCCTTSEPDGYDWDAETNNLSEMRARQIYLILIKNGIESSRLKFKGYGGSQKINRNESTEELRRVNRRVEIKILSR